MLNDLHDKPRRCSSMKEVWSRNAGWVGAITLAVTTPPTEMLSQYEWEENQLTMT